MQQGNKTTHSARETQNFAASLAKKLLAAHTQGENAMVIGLQGELGSGKTTFVQGFARGFGVKEKILSPTFIIMRSYKIPGSKYQIQNFYHIDCYRIEKTRDMTDLGWKDIVKGPQNIVLVEWPERIKTILPKNTITIDFQSTSENSRQISIS